MTPQRRNELVGILLLAVSIFLWMSLISYHPDDLGYFTLRPSHPVKNLCGMVGATVAGAIRTALGLTAYGLAALSFLWAMARFQGKPPQRSFVKLFSILTFVLSASSLLSIVWVQSPEARIYRGGVLGLVVGNAAVHYFGRWGAGLVLLTLSFLSFLLVTELTALPLLEKGVQACSLLGSRSLARIREACLWVVKLLSQIGRLPLRIDKLPSWLGQLPSWVGRLPSAWREGSTALVHRTARASPIPGTSPTVRTSPSAWTSLPARPSIKPATRPGGLPGGPMVIKIGTLETPAVGKAGSPTVKAGEPVFSKQPGSARELSLKEPAAVKGALSAKEAESVSAKRASSEAPSTGSGQVFRLPTTDLLNPPAPLIQLKERNQWLENNARVLEETLRDFGIDTKVAQVQMGPVITRYEVEPAAGVKVQKITALSDDLALAMKAPSVRIIAPIPGKARVGIEVPNPASTLVTLREVLESSEFKDSDSKLTLGFGKDAAGHPLVADLGSMPHLLIAGTTGSGKTVCVNSLITSILFQATPEEVRFLMVDPKMVELAPFNGLPHLILPVLTDPKKVPLALGWVVQEMETRYRLFARVGVRNIEAYHEKQAQGQLPEEEIPPELPYLVVIIDELADLMLVAQAEVERTIARLAHLSRAVGIHMVLATQRPSVDVLTGVIKANFPARISFQVASKVDSRTVLDTIGAEKLLGKGDLLFMQPGSSKLIRAQGTLVTDEEIERVVGFLTDQRPAQYDASILEEAPKGHEGSPALEDPLYPEAVRTVVEIGLASVSLLQRRLAIGYGRAARILDRMEEEGIVGPIRGAKPREVYKRGAFQIVPPGRPRLTPSGTPP